MNNKKIILAGGTGFIGQEMTKYFGKENKMVILTRQVNEKTNRNDYNSLSTDDVKNVCYVKWDGETVVDWINEMNNADLIINLAGKSVNCRYNEKNKKVM